MGLFGSSNTEKEFGNKNLLPQLKDGTEGLVLCGADAGRSLLILIVFSCRCAPMKEGCSLAVKLPTLEISKSSIAK